VLSLQGADKLTTYTFNTHQAKHTFCRTCGVQSFYQPRSNPDGYGNYIGYIGVASYGALGTCPPPPSTSNCLIFQITSEPHKLTSAFLCSKNIQAYSSVAV